MLRLIALVNKHKIDEVLDLLDLPVQPLGRYQNGGYNIEFFGSEDELSILVQALELGYVRRIEIEYTNR